MQSIIGIKHYRLETISFQLLNYCCLNVQLNDSVKDEILANQRMVPPGKSLMALNGALINIEDVDLYL